jgi:hypothetical protein
MWSDTPGKLSSTGYSRNDSTFLKSYHSVRNVTDHISHYSLMARSQALQRYFLEHRSLENAAPSLKNPDRTPDPSTLRRWFRSLDFSQPALRPTLRAIADWLARGEQLQCGPLRLSWPTLFPRRKLLRLSQRLLNLSGALDHFAPK